MVCHMPFILLRTIVIFLSFWMIKAFYSLKSKFLKWIAFSFSVPSLFFFFLLIAEEKNNNATFRSFHMSSGLDFQEWLLRIFFNSNCEQHSSTCVRGDVWKINVYYKENVKCNVFACWGLFFSTMEILVEYLCRKGWWE